MVIACLRTAAAILVVTVASGPAGAADPGCPFPVAESQRARAVALHRVGQEALRGSDWARAAQSFSEAVALDPGLLLAHYGLGQACMAQARYADAVRAFTISRDLFRCQALPSAEGRAPLAQAIDEEIRGLSEAIRSLERDRLVRRSIMGQEVNQSGPPSLGSSQRVLHELEKRLMELRAWRKELQRGARTPASLSLALGGAYFQMGALADAEREFQAVVAAHPRHADAHNNLAVVYMLTGRLDEAEQAVRTALRLGATVDPRLREEIAQRRRTALPSPPR